MSLLLAFTALFDSGNDPLKEVAEVFGAFLAVFIILICSGLLQLIFVPLLASKKGRDGAIWFVVTVIWLFFDASLIFVAIVVFGFLGLLGIASGDVEGILKGIACFVVALALVYLPLLVLLVSPSKASPLRPRRPLRTQFGELRRFLLRRKRPRSLPSGPAAAPAGQANPGAWQAIEEGQASAAETSSGSCPKCKGKLLPTDAKCANCGFAPGEAAKKTRRRHTVVVRQRNLLWPLLGGVGALLAAGLIILVAVKTGGESEGLGSSTTAEAEKAPPRKTAPVTAKKPSGSRPAPQAAPKPKTSRPKPSSVSALTESRIRGTAPLRGTPARASTPPAIRKTVEKDPEIRPLKNPVLCKTCRGKGSLHGGAELKALFREEVRRDLAVGLRPLVVAGQMTEDEWRKRLEDMVPKLAELEYQEALLKMKFQGTLPPLKTCSGCRGSGKVEGREGASKDPGVGAAVGPGIGRTSPGPSRPMKVTPPEPPEPKLETKPLYRWIFELKSGGRLRVYSYTQDGGKYVLLVPGGRVSIPKETVVGIKKYVEAGKK